MIKSSSNIIFWVVTRYYYSYFHIINFKTSRSFKINYVKIRIVIPCYNSENYIRTTFNHLRLVLNDCSSFDIDVFFIDDGSKDDTLATLRDLCSKTDKFHEIYQFYYISLSM